MPDIPFAVELFNSLDPTSTSLLERLNGGKEDEIQNLEHITQLPGGFERLTFVKSMDLAELEEWIRNRKGLHIKLANADQVVWNGRIEDPIFEAKDGSFPVRIRCYGYHYNFDDFIDFSNHSSTTGAAIIQDLRDNEIDAGSLRLSTNNGKMTAVTPTLTLNRAELGGSCLETIKGSDGVLAYPDDTGNPVDFAVWDDQEIYYQSRNPTEINWQVALRGNEVVNFDGEARLRDTANATYGLYAGPTFTAAAVNQSSINKVGRIERIAGSTDIDLNTAESARDKLLNTRSAGVVRGKSLTLARVRDRNYAIQPLCHIRAGDVIRILDFLVSGNRLEETLNSRNTFIITKTRCFHRMGNRRPESVELTLDSIAAGASRILAEFGIRG